MEQERLAGTLEALRLANEEAVCVLGQALSTIGESDLTRDMRQFRSDHEKQVRHLTSLLQDMGKRPAMATGDISGDLKARLGRVRQATDPEDLAWRLVLVERTIAEEYHQAMQQEMPLQVLQVLELHRRHEEMHADELATTLQVGTKA